jgi:hypothetical protein
VAVVGRHLNNSKQREKKKQHTKQYKNEDYIKWEKTIQNKKRNMTRILKKLSRVIK